ncbi:MAG: hypothetical protein JXQ96_19475 [Cyclobacteriaceae bacterium]
MNKNSKLMTLAMALVITLSSLSVQAGSDKTFNKAKAAVENASPDDWKTYAKSAKMLIRKNTNMAEAKQWIERSLKIRETSYNLEIMGDYYAKNNLPREAVTWYVKSMNKMKEEQNATIDTSSIQDKIREASAMK